MYEYSERLKMENSQKWRLKERDDWKALVENIQLDRDRLQAECDHLGELLDAAHRDIEIKEAIIECIRSGAAETSATGPEAHRSDPSHTDAQVASTPSSSAPSTLAPTAESNGSADALALLRPASPSYSMTVDVQRSDDAMRETEFMSPRSASRTLKRELEKAHTQVSIDCCAPCSHSKQCLLSDLY